MKKLVLLVVSACITQGTIEPIFSKSDTEALPTESLQARAYEEKAISEVQLRKFDKALEDVDKAHGLGLASAELFATKADALLHLRKYSECLAAIDSALSIEGKSPQASTLVIRAQAFAKSGQYDKAFVDYQLALKLEPYNSETLSKRASLCLELEQYRRAIEDSTKAISFDKSCALAYWVRSKALHALGDKEKAMSDKEMAKRLGFKDS
jgi:tetratricopeptide (TPR) repeat protein